MRGATAGLLYAAPRRGSKIPLANARHLLDKHRFSVHVSNDAHAFTVCRCGSPINGNLKYELRDSKHEVIVRHTAVMTAVTHARLCNTAPQAPDSELRTSYIVIRTFKLRLSGLLASAVCRMPEIAIRHSKKHPQPRGGRGCFLNCCKG